MRRLPVSVSRGGWRDAGWVTCCLSLPHPLSLSLSACLLPRLPPRLLPRHSSVIEVWSNDAHSMSRWKAQFALQMYESLLDPLMPQLYTAMQVVPITKLRLMCRYWNPRHLRVVHQLFQAHQRLPKNLLEAAIGKHDKEESSYSTAVITCIPEGRPPYTEQQASEFVQQAFPPAAFLLAQRKKLKPLLLPEIASEKKKSKKRRRDDAHEDDSDEGGGDSDEEGGDGGEESGQAGSGRQLRRPAARTSGSPAPDGDNLSEGESAESSDSQRVQLRAQIKADLLVEMQNTNAKSVRAAVAAAVASVRAALPSNEPSEYRRVWIKPDGDLNEADQGALSKIGVGRLLLVKTGTALSSLKTRKGDSVHQCIWKRMTVGETETAIAYIEMEWSALELLRHSPACPHVPRAFGPASMIAYHDRRFSYHAQVYAMEWVRGMSLHVVLEDSLHGLTRLVLDGGLASGACLVDQLAEGLAHLHQVGIVHRDVKPANIILTSPAIFDWMRAGNRLKMHASFAPRGDPEAQQAERNSTLRTDGFAPIESPFDTVHAEVPDTSRFRAVLLDFNISLLASDVHAVAKQEPTHQTNLYSQAWWFPSEILQAAGIQCPREESAVDSLARWISFDMFSFAMVIMDIFRVQGMDADVAKRPGSSQLQQFRGWCSDEFKKRKIPSLSNFFFDQVRFSSGSVASWGRPFVRKSVAATKLFGRDLPTIKALLHRMTRPHLNAAQLGQWNEESAPTLLDVQALMRRVDQADSPESMAKKMDEYKLKIYPLGDTTAFHAVLSLAQSLNEDYVLRHKDSLASLSQLQRDVIAHLKSDAAWDHLVRQYAYTDADKKIVHAEFVRLVEPSQRHAGDADLVLAALSARLSLRIRVISSTCSDAAADFVVTPLPEPDQSEMQEWPLIGLVQKGDEWHPAEPV